MPLLENWPIATDFSVAKTPKSVAKAICDRFFGRIKAGCKLICNRKNRSQNFATDFAHPLSIIKLVVCWLFCNWFFSRKFYDRKIGRKFLGKLFDLRPKNRSQIFNSSSLLPNIFCRKIGRKYNRLQNRLQIWN